MTEAELVEMEKLVESATPGPWRFVSTGYIETFESEDELHRDVAMLGREGTETDGKLLAASRAFVPAAIAEIRRRGADVRRLREEKARHHFGKCWVMNTDGRPTGDIFTEIATACPDCSALAAEGWRPG